MLKYTLVPSDFFSAESAEEYLSSVIDLQGEETSVKYKELPQFKAVLVYSDEGDDCASRVDEICALTEAAAGLDQYNKVVARIGGGYVDVVLVAGEKLLLCNSFPSVDEVTALYYIFASLKQFQINPGITTLFFYGNASSGIMGDAARYFKSVEIL